MGAMYLKVQKDRKVYYLKNPKIIEKEGEVVKNVMGCQVNKQGEEIRGKDFDRRFVIISYTEGEIKMTSVVMDNFYGELKITKI